MSTWEIVLLILFGICLMGALVQKKWNDFFYYLCTGLVVISELPVFTSFIALIFLLILHVNIRNMEN